MVSGQHFIHHYFYGSSHYRFFAFVTYAKHMGEIVLSSYQDQNMKEVIRHVIISRAREHLDVSFIFQMILQKI